MQLTAIISIYMIQNSGGQAPDFIIILCAIFGGLGANALRLAELANHSKKDRPDIKDPYYIFQFILTPILGAILVYVYLASGTSLTPILALNIGASAPLVFKSLASATPPIAKKSDVTTPGTTTPSGG